MTVNAQSIRPLGNSAEAARILAEVAWAGSGVLIIAGWLVVTRLGVSQPNHVNQK